LDGHADLTYVMAAAEEIAQNLAECAVVVTQSTVPLGPNRKVSQVITRINPNADFEVYRPLFLRDFPIVSTDLESAEMINYAANAFLATKITFINEIAALCEKVGDDVKNM